MLVFTLAFNCLLAVEVSYEPTREQLHRQRLANEKAVSSKEIHKSNDQISGQQTHEGKLNGSGTTEENTNEPDASKQEPNVADIQNSDKEDENGVLCRCGTPE